jgi:hypothetical protein
VLLLALAIVTVFGIAAQQALAKADGSYTHGGASCSSCHSPALTNDSCTACHTGGFVAVSSGAPKTCWTCHTPGQSMSTVQTASGCASGVGGAACHGTTAKHVGATLPGGCTSCHSVVTGATKPSNSSHHVVSYTVKPALSLSLSATRILLGRTVTAKGVMHRVIKGGTVTITVQKKNLAGVYKPLLKKVVTSTALETYSWKYKPLKKGSYRMRSSVPASGKIRAGVTAYKTFTVR